MSEGKHSPLPWAIDPIERFIVPEADPDMPVCALRCESDGVERPESDIRADAELIVRAVNSHDGLVEALKEALRYILGHRDMPPGIRERIDAALAKAEGK